MKIHDLKIKIEYFNAISSGKKTFELRKNDRGFEIGDLIQFHILNKTPVRDLYVITYILKDVPEYGLDKDYCILGIKKAVITEVQ